ncbi:MAG: MBL fold metallo-hydrolase [Actinobacteria bacterium]|nr:MBL fold metallo-hydrolase [Actinomycetota bacterium]
MEEVIEGVFLLKRVLGSNVYFIPGDTSAMIDSGFPFDSRRILGQVTSNGYNPPSILVATHYHLDHTGSMSHLKSMLGSKVAAHEHDAAFMEGEKDYEVFRVDTVRRVYYRTLAPFFRNRLVDVDMRLSEGDTLNILGGLNVIHIPGHTQGSIALYQPERGILFSGDTIRNENSILEGPPALFTPELERSFFNIRNKLCGLPLKVILPGHGAPVFEDAQKKVTTMMQDIGRMP